MHVTILFGLFVIWTGLLRGIEAQQFKPNAFWFCFAMGMMAIGAGFLYRLGQIKVAIPMAMISGAIVLVYYVSCFTSQPEQDATYRVGLVIVAAVAQIVFALLPPDRGDAGKNA